MKFLLLLFLAGLAMARPDSRQTSFNPVIQDTSFRPGREYIYDYDTQVLTGFPEASKLHAGFRISCRARVQFNTMSKVRVQFQEMVLYRINEPVVQWQASERLMPEEVLKELVGDEAVSMQQFLQIPFGFEYDDGMVLRILLDDKETTWSANIKRGFVSLFEMNLEKRLLLDESYPSIKSQLPPHANWYTVFERSTVGDCATLYTVTPNAEDDYKYVTKVRDYSRCLNRQVYVNTIVDGHFAQDAQKDDPIVNGATVKYNIKGDDKKFIILSAIGEGKIGFSAYKNQEHIRTDLNQTLHLKEAKYIGREVLEIPEIHHGQHKRDTIQLTLPSSPVDCRDPFVPCKEEPKQVSEPADVYTADKIYLHLKMAAENTRQITTEESIAHLRIVKDMLKTTPEPILKTLWNKLSLSKVEPQASLDRFCAQIYWETLTQTGTEDAANVVLDVCTTDMRMSENCTLALADVVLRTAPTPKIISKLLKLTIAGKKSPIDRKVVYLSLGSFAYKLTQEMNKEMVQCEKTKEMLKSLVKDNSKHARRYIRKERKQSDNRCSRVVSVYSQTEEKIMQVLKRLAESSRQSDKILGLKSIGNSGLKGCLPILRRIVTNPAESMIVRIMAITAHRRIQYPEAAKQQAIQTLLKLYLTTSETNEIRTMAFLVMTGLQPDQPILETVAMSLRTEKDAHVSNFVYSFFKTYSNSDYQPDWPMQKNCTAALKFAPEKEIGFQHSFMKRVAVFDADHKKGNALSVAMVGDMSRYMGAAINWDTYNYGLISPAVEVGFNTEGMSPFFDNLFGAKGILTSEKSPFDLLRRAPRDISPQQQIRQILENLRIKPRTMPAPYGHMYYKVMGHEIFYVDFTNILRGITVFGNFQTNVNEENLKMGLPIKINQMMDNRDEQITYPTEAGFPISMKVKNMATIDLQGSLNLEVAPYMMESDRQGQPPNGLHLGLDLKPRVVLEAEFSMGLDMFYLKPIVGNRALIKFNAPIKTDVVMDLSSGRLNLKWFNPIPVMEEPAVEILVEPFSEFLVITKKNESPVFMSDRRNIYAHAGIRVLPIAESYKLHTLGYQLDVTGQRPICTGSTYCSCLYDGRFVLNLMWKPMQDASDYFQFVIQQIGANNYDQHGRTLPQTVEEILPYNDPIDIQNKSVNLRQVCNKLQTVFGKPMPFYNQENTFAIVFVLDASSKTTKRQVQVETLSFSKEGRIGQWYNRVWRSSIPGYDTKEWQMLFEMGTSYPYETMEPKDIFDPSKQRELMKDLEYLISLESHKVSNQGINMTLLSALEQLNYPAMIRVPTFRILDSLVPEQLYNLMNVTGNTMYNRRWDAYWRNLGPIYRQVSQEVRVNVDPYFVNQDLPMMDHLDQILSVQHRFIRDIRALTATTLVAHAELPIIQWIDYTQAKTVFWLRDIYNKAIVKNLIHDAVKIRGLLIQSEANVDTIISLMSQLLKKVSTVSQETDENGKPVVVCKPQMLFKQAQQNSQEQLQRQRYEDETVYSYDRPSYYNVEDIELTTVNQQPENFYNLRLSLYNLTIAQMNFIEQVKQAITQEKQVDISQLSAIIVQTKDNLNIVDEVLKRRAIIDPVTRQSLLMVTVQNEFTIQLLEQWKRVSEGKTQLKNIASLNTYVQKMMTLKEQGSFLGERVSMLYHQNLLRHVVVPHLTTKEYPIYNETAAIKRQMVPELREFEIQVAYNLTNMKEPKLIFANINKFVTKINSHVSRLSGIVKSLNEIGQTPKLYVMSEIMDTLHYLKYITEFGSRTLYSINDQRKFAYLQSLSTYATKVQGLISSLSPIFNKYSQYDETDIKSHMVMLNTMPIDTRVLDVQDVLVEQKMIRDQITRVLRNPYVSSNVLSKILDSAVDRCEVLQETLKQNQLQVQSALEERKVFERQALSVIWTKALNNQNDLYEAMLNIYHIHQERLHDVVRSSERINDLQREISTLEGDHEQKMDSLQKQDVQTQYENYRSTYYTQPMQDEPTRPTQKKFQPLTPFEYLPTGLTCLMNFTWGNGHELNKNLKMQLMASRSVEQIMNLFKQMNAVVRDQDIVDSINGRLSDEPWLADPIMQDLNTFNHLHFVAEGQQEHLPEWLLNLKLYLRDFFKAHFWNSYHRQPATHFISKNQIHALFDISAQNKEVDLYLLDNQETGVYQGVQMPNCLNGMTVFQNYKPLKEKIISYVTNNQKPSKCMVSKNKVYTFDNVNYQLPSNLEQQEVLLAASCGDEKTFAITMKKSKNSFDGQTVKIINYDRIVEITPGYLDTEVRVDGQIKVLENNKPLTFTKRLNYNKYQPSLKISRKGLTVTVEFPLSGIYLVMEGNFFQIQISEIYKRTVCGLCSNFDSQRSWEFEGPRKEIYTSSKLFAQSYILNKNNRHTFSQNKPEFTVQNDKYFDVVSHFRPKGGVGKFVEDDDEKDVDDDDETEMNVDDQEQLEELDQPEIQSTFQHQQDPEKDQQQSSIEQQLEKEIKETKQTFKVQGWKLKKDAVCGPQERTLVRNRRIRQQTCFSLVPVSRCIRKSPCPKVIRSATVQLRFVCLDSNDSRVEDLRDLADKGPIRHINEIHGERITRKARKHLRCQA